ncbi:MAG: hypothetical protein IKD69_14410 [Solobacterium sp.]|nr:hypothetical protein [Solobacterium sp.]
MEGWVHGPVAPDVRHHHDLVAEAGYINDDQSRHILDETLARFSRMSALDLRQLSHRETS